MVAASIGLRPSAAAPAAGSPGDPPGTPWAAVVVLGRASSRASPAASAPSGAPRGTAAPSLASLRPAVLRAGREKGCDPLQKT